MDNLPDAKACTKCGVCKPLSDFAKMKTGRYGLNARCKECYREYQREYAKRPAAIQYQKQKVRRRQRVDSVKRYLKKASDLLTDHHIKRILWKKKGIRNPPPELIQLKREQIELHRIAKSLKRVVTESKEQQ